ncbi:hypothetical protein U3516DRAFT_769097 [Neocallimastix sp. 'constans']
MSPEEFSGIFKNFWNQFQQAKKENEVFEAKEPKDGQKKKRESTLRNKEFKEDIDGKKRNTSLKNVEEKAHDEIINSIRTVDVKNLPKTRTNSPNKLVNFQAQI